VPDCEEETSELAQHTSQSNEVVTDGRVNCSDECDAALALSDYESSDEVTINEREVILFTPNYKASF
jgi:hypothetical protein